MYDLQIYIIDDRIINETYNIRLRYQQDCRLKAKIYTQFLFYQHSDLELLQVEPGPQTEPLVTNAASSLQMSFLSPNSVKAMIIT